MAAVGLIETQGLVGVIEAADAAAKAAQIELLGIEQVGAGLVSVRFSGEVAAVQVAVQAGVEAALKVSQVVSHHVIPSPHLDLNNLLQDPSPTTPATAHHQKAETKSTQQHPTPHTLDELDNLPVVRLRQLVRQMPNAALKGRQVSRANKKALIDELRRNWSPDV